MFLLSRQFPVRRSHKCNVCNGLSAPSHGSSPALIPYPDQLLIVTCGTKRAAAKSVVCATESANQNQGELAKTEDRHTGLALASRIITLCAGIWLLALPCRWYARNRANTSPRQFPFRQSHKDNALRLCAYFSHGPIAVPAWRRKRSPHDNHNRCWRRGICLVTKVLFLRRLVQLERSLK
jgi:hypothetical protein